MGSDIDGRTMRACLQGNATGVDGVGSNGIVPIRAHRRTN
jgi:hypothetical protein